MLKELFPDWTDADLVLAIEDSDGDLERTIEKISEGEYTRHTAALPLFGIARLLYFTHQLTIVTRLCLAVC
jgi:hypothetical protein